MFVSKIRPHVERRINAFQLLNIFSILRDEKMFGGHQIFFPFWKTKKHKATTRRFAWLIVEKTPSSH